MIVRDATGDDLIGITAIYNDAVLNTTAIWNETPVDVANRAAWLTARREAGYPVLVAVTDAGAVGGYASFGDWRPFEGYRFTVEHSVYVEKDARGLGIGRALMDALIERAVALGKHVMVAGIEDGNRASIALHERLGFVTVGVATEVGTKFGRWLDLRFMQLTLPVSGATTPLDRTAL
ncbi:GNAT family N-acetyltransferase [Ensifer soli]|uniref:GNAT family N-acetyltransferase n=1 Tax=Ciceribacter sp. sgz301302 TaxID=3342379 RepID=UPI0035B9BB94